MIARLPWLITLLLVACRPDPGPSPYAQQESFDGGGFLPGPDPYAPGEARLSVGAFYEGQSSESISVDSTHHLYLYGTDPANPGSNLTVALQPDSDRVEGTMSTDVVLTGQPWWGLGVNWDNAFDMTAWKTLHVSFRSKDADFASFTVGMNNAIDSKNQKTITVNATDYGYKNDNAWHSLAIPTSAFAGLNLAQVTAPFVLAGTGASGAILKVDNLYFTAK
jgi:hypothetical protein